MNSSFFEKILSRAQKLGAEDVQNYLIKLAKEKGFFETIFNTLHEGVIVLDPHGKIEYANTAATRLLSLPEDKALYGPLSRYLRGIDWEPLLSEQRSTSRVMEITYPEHRIVEFYLLPLDEASHTHPRASFVAIFHDITQTHQATQAAIESERIDAITLLAAGVAHELGNPLNSLHIHLQLMERDLEEAPPEVTQRLRESIQIAREEIERLDNIITQFLRAIRPVKPDLAPGRVEQVLKETLKLLQHEIHDRDILIKQDISTILPEIMIDSQQLQQASYNIIRNAIQAIGKTGVLRIQLSCYEPWLIASFTDNGSGIEATDLPHLTQPYFTTKKGGHGLGLMVVQRVVRAHGGELEIESKPGEGTTVRIKLPLMHKRMHLLSDTPATPPGSLPSLDWSNPTEPSKG